MRIAKITKNEIIFDNRNTLSWLKYKPTKYDVFTNEHIHTVKINFNEIKKTYGQEIYNIEFDENFDKLHELPKSENLVSKQGDKILLSLYTDEKETDKYLYSLLRIYYDDKKNEHKHVLEIKYK